MQDQIPLSPLQKMAWFNLIIFAVALALYALGVPLLAWLCHQSLATAALPSLGVFGICGLWGLGNRFFYDRRKRAKISLDERETLINHRANTIGMFMFWEVLVVLCMGAWTTLRYVYDQATIPVDVLPALIFLGMIVFTLTQSVAILVQYKRSATDDPI